MIDYPNLSEWNSKLSSQANGFALWFGAVILVCLYLLWARKRWPLVTRLGGMGLYVAALGITGRDFLPAFPLIGALGYLGYRWFPSLKRTPTISLILLGALVVRLPGLWTESLWYDETFTYGLARLDFPHMMTVIQSDVHPPLWYIVEWITIRILGSSEAALRFPSLLCGLLVVYLIYRLALALQQPRPTALVAAAIVSVLPAALHYSHEARGYSLLAAAVLLMTIAVLERKPFWFFVAGVVALYTHNLGWFYVGVMGLTGLYIRRSHRGIWLIACALVALTGAMWLPTALRQSADIADGFWLQTLNLGEFLRTIVIGTMYTKIPTDLLLPITGGVVGISVLSVAFALRWLLSSRGMVYLVMVLGAPLLIAIVSIFWRNVFIERAVLASMLAMSIVWARLLTLSYKGDGLAIAGAVTPMLALGLVLYYTPSEFRFDARNLLPRACQNTDVTYTTTNSLAFIANYYLPNTVVWPDSNDLNQQLPPEAKTALGWEQMDFNQLRGRVCLIDAENALNRADERAYVQSILTNPHRSQTLYVGEIYTVRVHIIQAGL